MSDKNNLGRILKQRRISLGLGLKEVGATAGVSSSHLGRIERGERFPSATILRKLAKPLVFEEAELLTWGGYLSSQPPDEAEGRIGPDLKRVDPYVAAMLSQEPVEVQRAVITILIVMKSMAKVLDAEAVRKTDQCRGNG